ncbi:hypothetical protein ACLOJK_022038 [Asimina triloba]
MAIPNLFIILKKMNPQQSLKKKKWRRKIQSITFGGIMIVFLLVGSWDPWLKMFLTDPHPPPPTSAPPRVILQSPSCRRRHQSPFFRRVSGIRAVDRPPPLPEKTLPKSQSPPPPLPSPEKKIGSPNRRLAGVGNVHSSPEKKEHYSSGTPAEHCADFSSTPAPRQRLVIATSAAQ